MSSDDKNLAGAMDAGQIEWLARVVALQGKAEAVRLQAIAERAQEMLADPAFATSTAGVTRQPTPHLWEAEEVFPPGARRATYLASAEDYATGEGLTIYFAAGFGRSEGEFRRKLAGEWGVPLADRARIGHGLNAAVPFAAMFMTPSLRAAIDAFEHACEPAAFSYFARHHANFS